MQLFEQLKAGLHSFEPVGSKKHKGTQGHVVQGLRLRC